jgi:hypothetical protein
MIEDGYLCFIHTVVCVGGHDGDQGELDFTCEAAWYTVAFLLQEWEGIMSRAESEAHTTVRVELGEQPARFGVKSPCPHFGLAATLAKCRFAESVPGG